MSNILRRPMFRGGRVDSRGTGITSGLGYAGGGQIGGGTIYGNPMPDGRYGFANPQPANMALFLANQANAPTTGASLFESALSKVRSVPYAGRILGPLLGTAASPFLGAAATGIGLGSLADWYRSSTFTPEAYIEEKKAYEQNPMIGQETDLIVDEMGNTTTSYDALQSDLKKLNVGEKPGFFPRGGYDKFLADRGIDPKTGRKPEPIVPKEGGNNGDGNKGDGNKGDGNKGDGNIVSAETSDITLDDYIRMLGGDKARQRDIGDIFGRLSAAALKRPGRGEERGLADVLGDFMTAEVAAGPGRREKIEQTAAMLDIKDKIESKRSRENIKQLMGMELFKNSLSAKNIAANVSDAQKAGLTGSAAVSRGLQMTYPNNPNKIPKIVKESLPDITENDIGSIFIVEKTDPKTKTTTSRVAVEVVKDASGKLSVRPLYTD
jgi:hypothetical protein